MCVLERKGRYCVLPPLCCGALGSSEEREREREREAPVLIDTNRVEVIVEVGYPLRGSQGALGARPRLMAPATIFIFYPFAHCVYMCVCM